MSYPKELYDDMQDMAYQLFLDLGEACHLVADPEMSEEFIFSMEEFLDSMEDRADALHRRLQNERARFSQMATAIEASEMRAKMAAAIEASKERGRSGEDAG